MAATVGVSKPGVRQRTRKVCRWRDGGMVLRWVAGAYLVADKHFRKIQGYRDLWVLAAALGRPKESGTPHEKVA